MRKGGALTPNNGTDMRETGKSNNSLVVRISTALLTLLVSLSASGFEQTAMHFDRLSVTEGLSQNTVTAIAQDQTGFMWFATERGLDRYDGFTFKNYRTERGNPNSLASEFIRDLNLAEDGSLWLATDGGGVSHWKPETDSFTTYRHDPQNATSLSSDRIRTLLADSNGSVWVGTRNSGLDRLDIATGEVTHFLHVPGDTGTLSNNDIYALALDADGMLWIGTGEGLNRLDVASGEITRFQGDKGDPSRLGDTPVSSLLIDHEGTLWAGTSGGGLHSFSAETNSFEHFIHDGGDPFSLSSNRVEVIFEDDMHRIWIGTDKGLNLMGAESGKFVTYKNDPTNAASLSNDFVFSIFQDRGGVLWVSTNTGGLNKWNPRSWSFGHIRPPVGGDGSDFSNPNVTSFTEDPAGNVWVGTFGGGINVMDRYDGSVRQLRRDSKNPEGLSGDRVMALLTDRDGQIWAGTMTGGLNRIDPETRTVHTFRHDPSDETSIAADGVMSLFEDRAGALWVGTFGGGVSRLDPGTDHFVNYRHDPADDKTLSSPRATSIVEDIDGVIWVGTDGGGLNRLDRANGAWQHFVHDDDDPASLSADTVYALHVDAGGTLWIGTRAGLNQFTVDGIASADAQIGDVSALESLTNDAVYSIQSDATRDLWLGTARGLTRFSPGTGGVRSFHESQGLQGEEFNFGASYANASGQLFFGGSNGFNAFNPAELEFNQQPPPVVLTSLSILNKPVSTARPYERIETIDLGYSDDVVTFGISALDFSAPHKNRYSYQLVGFDDAWVDAGKERRITYTNLDGGNYTFRVRAANGDGYWNTEGISIPLHVALPPWQTWWAYTLYMMAVLMVALGFVRRQQQKLRRESEYSRRLEQEVRERTEELKNRNVDLKDANARLSVASTSDPLTGLKNRRFLFEQVSKDIDIVLRHYRDGTETLKPSGNNDLLFLMVDLDNFKPVNDSCGHEAGDKLLLQIRDVLLEACRSSDDVIRWGGDEFLVVARDTNRKYAATLAERIRSNLSQRVFAIGNGQVARSTASIGYASFPFIKEQPDLLQWEEVLGVADAAMYEAKKKRNAWLGIEGIAWDGSGNDLYRAIKSDPGKLAENGVLRSIESVDDAAESAG